MSTNPQYVLPHFDWAAVGLKVKTTLTSRKFWAMLAALVIVWAAHMLAPAQVTLLNAVQGTIAALGVWSTGVAIEGIGGASTVAGLLASPAGQIVKAQVVRIVQVWLASRGIALDVAAVEQSLEQLVTTAAAAPEAPPVPQTAR